jgi:hypothetical protein
MKNLLIIVGLVIGVAVGYFIPHPQEFDFTNKDISKAALDQLAANPTVLQKILPEHRFEFRSIEKPIKKDDAMKWINDFRVQNNLDIRNGGGFMCIPPDPDQIPGSPAPSGPPAGPQELGGFVISDTTIQKIYKNDGTQKCTGLRIYLAKREGTGPTARFFTFIVVGTKDNGKGTKGTGGDIETPIIEHVDPCPTNCGQLRP